MAGVLYKQGTQKLEIIVRKDTGGATASGATANGSGLKGLSTKQASGGQTDMSDQSNIDNDSTKGKTLKSFAIAGSISIAKQTAFFGFDYYVGGIGMRNGDQALQDQVQRKVELFKDTVNVASSIAVGAIAGSVFGPVGAVVGGLLGAVTSGLSIAQRQIERQRQYDYTIFKENNAIEYSKARAGNSLTTGRNR